MALATIISKARELILRVSGMGLVYEYEIWVAQLSALRALCVVNGRVNVWTIADESTAEHRLASRANENHILLVIRGYYALADNGATKIAFRLIYEGIRTMFRDKINLEGVAEKSDPIQIRIAEERYFCEVLCHYVEMVLIVHELIDW